MLPQQYCLRWKYHHSNLQTMFSQLLDRGCFCDVTLACEGQLIRAHRVVLCACSTFFDTVLTNYSSERDPIIIMKDVTFADVKCLIEFMYKGEINVEHAHLASLLKTADDLKIKGLAEVSWREDDDGPPPPTPHTEFHLPTLEAYPQEHQQRGVMSPIPVGRGADHDRELKSPSPSGLAGKIATTRMPTLTPIPTASSSISVAAAASGSSASPVDPYLGPKRKRGRPPLDDAYDVFNIRKIAQYAAHMDHQAYLEARHYSDEQQRQHHTPTVTSPTAAAAAYQQHIHQQQNKQQRMRHRHQQQPPLESEEHDHEDAQTDPEWITSNLEVNVAECEQTTDNGSDITESELKEPTAEVEVHELDYTKASAAVERKKQRERTRSDTPEEREPREIKEREKVVWRDKAQRKHSREDEHEIEVAHAQEEKFEKMEKRKREAVLEEQDNEADASAVPKPVEEIESVRQVLEQQLPQATTSSSASASVTHLASSSACNSSSASHKTTSHSQQPPPPPPPPLHHPPTAHHNYGKYAPEGYLLNEHGMLMTHPHDYVHAPTANIPTASSSASSTSGVGAMGTSSNGANENDFADIKMEDYDVADLRLTSEEMSQWQDVIKMDDYLAKGRRPQFWEEPFTRRVLDAIKNKRLEMKKAARILGVSYGTLYGRYREVYGCLKHPYSSTTFRPSQSSQLAVQPRFDIVWPSPKARDGLLPGQLEIGKIRPKDLSELWTRPQI